MKYNAAFFGLYENLFLELKKEFGSRVALALFRVLMEKGLKTAYGLGASDSAVHVTYTDPISGGQALSQTFVTVEKA